MYFIKELLKIIYKYLFKMHFIYVFLMKRIFYLTLLQSAFFKRCTTETNMEVCSLSVNLINIILSASKVFIKYSISTPQVHIEWY